MSIRFMCPDCQVVLSIAARKGGTQIICPNCKQPIIVPQPVRIPQLGILLEDVQPSRAISEKDWKAAPPPVREWQRDLDGDSRSFLVIQLNGESDAEVRLDAPIGDCESLPQAARRAAAVVQPVCFEFSSTIDRAEHADDEEDRFGDREIQFRKKPGAAGNKMPPIRNLIAFALTVGSFVFIAIGVMQFHTKHWLAYCLVALCLAIASLAVLYVGRRRRRRCRR